MRFFFIFFALSGFSTLVYQVVWLRIAMANFGVTTISVSIVLSVFMAGMALGSWLAGRYISRARSLANNNTLLLYAAAEACIGLSGFVVAPLLGLSHKAVISTGWAGLGTNINYLVSAAFISAVLLPFCACMGATFPLAVSAARRCVTDQSDPTFSYLYVANVLGAMLGTVASAFVLIELVGFQSTMKMAAALNIFVAVSALVLNRKETGKQGEMPLQSVLLPDPVPQKKRFYLLLFVTGLASLAMEVVWIRMFTPLLGPVVYTFAAILTVYLGATLLGAQLYRYVQKRNCISTSAILNILTMVAVAGLFPFIGTDIRLPPADNIAIAILRIAIGIGPFCALLGFATPAIIDRISWREPGSVGTGYAFNMIGCIAGPLVASSFLLPFAGERYSLILLSGIILSVVVLVKLADKGSELYPKFNYKIVLGVVLVSFTVIVITKDRDSYLKNEVVLRDHTATVVAAGEGMFKLLIVNGVGMTSLTPITKMMVHLPFVLHDGPVKKGLVICLGMGTSYRSMLSWGISSTVVELVPSIPKLLPFYHADGDRILASEHGRIVVDDGRRFLERSGEKFDVVVVDPPPPIEAAASSLLYSAEFYQTVKKRLAQGGILQQWIPLGACGGGTDEAYLLSSMMKSIVSSFNFVKVYYSFGELGLHIIASMDPILAKTPAELSKRLNEEASADLVEWGPNYSAEEQIREVMLQETSVKSFLDAAPEAPPLTDDRPVNEYFVLRRTLFNNTNK